MGWEMAQLVRYWPPEFDPWWSRKGGRKGPMSFGFSHCRSTHEEDEEEEIKMMKKKKNF